ncbi:MAG: YbaB/EbfC family nucleoid-associated protein [Phycisphaerae bacterium]|jgi:DNA-binding YbaB/EbfC family protein
MFGDLGKMIKLAGEMKRRLPEIQAKIAASQYSADAGGGAVTATVNGKMQLVDLKISTPLLAEGDAAMLEDLIKAAVSAAQDKAATAAAEAMNELTGGMPLPPGMDGLLG